MQPNDPTRRGLSEISHLFLSSVRDRQTQGTPRPQRTPPPKGPINIELSPEESAGGVTPEPGVDAMHSAGLPTVEASHTPPVTGLLVSHLNGHRTEYAARYARELAARCGRVGMIDLHDGTVSLSCFDPSGCARGEQADPIAQPSDERQVAEALAELNCDVNHWLLIPPAGRSAADIELLNQIDQWVLLSTCDHDGIVAGYRLLKGISEQSSRRPTLSLALLNAKDEAEVTRVTAKLIGVCQQFLNWTLQSEGAIGQAAAVAAHLVMCAQLPSPATAVGRFVGDLKALAEVNASDAAAAEPVDPAIRELVGDIVVPAPVPTSETPYPRVTSNAEVAATISASEASQSTAARWASGETESSSDAGSDILDLPNGQITLDSIVQAFLHRFADGSIQCPIRAPMCPSARLAITRDRQLELFAATDRGLANLRSIAAAYRWLSENRPLIAMALPQLSIDTASLPRLRLLVDQSDLSADLLQPLLQMGQITVQSFRRLRWGEKTGLLLEAA